MSKKDYIKLEKKTIKELAKTPKGKARTSYKSGFGSIKL